MHLTLAGEVHISLFKKTPNPLGIVLANRVAIIYFPLPGTQNIFN